MPRPRTNDPLGLSDYPTNVVTDPQRIKELTNEFKKRLAHIRRSYLLAVEALGGDKAFNESFARLNRSLARKRPAKVRGVRAHPELELVISEFARRHAAERTGIIGAEVTQEDANAGAQKAAEVLAPRIGRSRNTILRHHVEGLMALLQETVGKPVLLTLQKDHEYDPQAVGKNGEMLIMLARLMESEVAITTLASMVKTARKKYASRPMCFADYFPGYGVTGDLLAGPVDIGGGRRIESFVPNIPIYFP